jgi:hypothetical protein
MNYVNVHIGYIGSLDSVVVTESALRSGQPKNRVSNPRRGRDFYLLQNIQIGSGDHRSSTRVKRPRREANHSYIQHRELVVLYIHAFICLHAAHRDNLACTLGVTCVCVCVCVCEEYLRILFPLRTVFFRLSLPH